ncbi:MAG: hypothetical protein GX456_20370 [Verrucomicrobia bacterium]|nr:hypothetical protein [Verrucomicrobiota bacterium]
MALPNARSSRSPLEFCVYAEHRFTFHNARVPQRAGAGNGFGSAAVPGRINPTPDPAPVLITQTRRPIFDRLGAAKNRRAPARAGAGNGVGSAAVPGRINPTTDRTARFDHANPAAGHSREPQVHLPGMNLAFGPIITAMLHMFLHRYGVKYGQANVWD